MIALRSRDSRRPLRVAALAVVFPAVVAGLPAPAALAQPRQPLDHTKPVVLRGATSQSWRLTPSVETRPLESAEGPARHARPHALRDCSARPKPATTDSSGEGLVSLTMSAPGTSWASAQDTSVVVDVWLGRGAHRTTPQQIVLFNGGQPFRYQAFLGHLGPGSHCLTVRVDPANSSDADKPVIDVFSARLRIVPKSSPEFLAVTHAPVMYARTSSASNDAQILTDVAQAPDGQDTDLAYTVIWTRERVGDGQVPFYEWGKFGRMTDIETVLHEKVAPNGKILSATYLSCGCESMRHYPDDENAPPGPTTETQVAYPSSGTPPALGHHLVLRDATGNNDESPYGRTHYRMQQLPVVGAGPTQTREIVMDRHPWTYRLSNEDVSRTSSINTDPKSTGTGLYPQYLVVDIDADATGTSSVSVGVQLSGDPTWWTNDYQQSATPVTGLDFYNGGHGRTVIKLPTDWHSDQITALQLQLHAQAGQTAALNGTPTIHLIEVTKGFAIHYRPVPTPTVVTS